MLGFLFFSSNSLVKVCVIHNLWNTWADGTQNCMLILSTMLIPTSQELFLMWYQKISQMEECLMHLRWADPQLLIGDGSLISRSKIYEVSSCNFCSKLSNVINVTLYHLWWTKESCYSNYHTTWSFVSSLLLMKINCINKNICTFK